MSGNNAGASSKIDEKELLRSIYRNQTPAYENDPHPWEWEEGYEPTDPAKPDRQWWWRVEEVKDKYYTGEDSDIVKEQKWNEFIEKSNIKYIEKSDYNRRDYRQYLRDNPFVEDTEELIIVLSDDEDNNQGAPPIQAAMDNNENPEMWE